MYEIYAGVAFGDNVSPIAITGANSGDCSDDTGALAASPTEGAMAGAAGALGCASDDAQRVVGEPSDGLSAGASSVADGADGTEGAATKAPVSLGANTGAAG